MASGKNSNVGNSNWYRVKDQKFIQNVKEKTEDAVIVEKDGKTFFQEQKTWISGTIKRLFIHEEDNGNGGTYKEFTIEMVDEGKKENIQMYFDSNEALSFIKRLPNIDLTTPVKIIIRSTEPKTGKNGKVYKNGRLDVYQEREGKEELVPMFYNEENKLPSFEEKTLNGKRVWDKTNLYAKLEEVVNEANEKLGVNPNARDFTEVTTGPDATA